MASRDSYRWLLVGVGFAAYLVADGSYNIGGLFYAAHRRRFQQQPTALAFVYGLAYGAGQLLSPLMAALIRARGERQLALASSLCLFCGYCVSYFATDAWLLLPTFGLLIPFGSQGCYLFPMACLARQFDKRLALACGIAVSGGGIGLLASAPLAQWLIREFTWRGACLVLGAASLNAGALGLLVRPRDPAPGGGGGGDDALGDNGVCSLPLLKSLTRPAPLAFFASGLLQAFGIVVIINFVPTMAKESSISDEDIKWYPAVFGISFTVGNLLLGFAGSRVSPLAVDGVSMLCEGCAVAALPHAMRAGFGLSLANYAAMGFFYGSRYALMCASVKTLSGRALYEIFHVCFLITFFFGSLPSPYVGQLLRDARGSFDVTFYSAAVVFVATGLLRLATLLLHRSSRSSATQQPDAKSEELVELRAQQ